MSNSYRAAASLGGVIIAISSVTIAAPPINFDEWSVSDGDISTDVACPAGFTCGAAVVGKGFFQRQISEDSSGDDYFQTIITDVDSTGDPTAPGDTMRFADESFVKQGNSTGLANKSRSFESTTTGTVTELFQSSTELLTGWANNGSGGSEDDEARIYQNIAADDTAAEDFDSQFWLSQVGDQGATGKHMRIAGTVEIVEGAPTASTQNFVLVDILGEGFVTAGTADLGTDGSITWADDDHIKAIWVGQDMSDVADVAQEFGYTAYEDFIGAGTLISTFSVAVGSAAGPVDWDAPGVWGSSDPTDAGPFVP